MKLRRTGCTNCRKRHSKCIVLDGTTICTRCAETPRGPPCVFETKFGIHEVKHIHTGVDAGRKRYDFKYGKNQKWVATDGPFEFLSEDFSEPIPSCETRQGSKSHSATLPQVNLDIVLSESAIELPGWGSTTPPNTYISGQDSNTLISSNQSFPITPATTTHDSPLIALPDNHPSSYPDLQGIGNDFHLSKPILTGREADLFRSYIERLGPWADIADTTRHFTTEVPRRALKEPLMLYGVLGLASRQRAIVTGSDQLEASQYHNKCLELVIDKLSYPEETYDENLLAGVILLRCYEEFVPKEDARFHFFGSYQLLNTIATFSSGGGLGEAASWLSLRQALYVSLIHKEPIEIRLENYENSAMFKGEETAESYAHAAILLIAKVLACIHCHDADDIWKRQRLEELEEDVDLWIANKSENFEPIYYKSADPKNDIALADIRMLSSAAVIGLQHIYGAKILLALHRPLLYSSGYQAAKETRDIEKSIRYHLCVIVALANSNRFVENANFTASHFLMVCGYCLHDPLQREAAIKFLLRTEETMGWRTAHTIEALREQWSDLDSA